MSKLLDLKEQFEQLQNKYEEYLPKFDADVINDLPTRQRESPLSHSLYDKSLYQRRN